MRSFLASLQSLAEVPEAELAKLLTHAYQELAAGHPVLETHVADMAAAVALERLSAVEKRLAEIQRDVKVIR